MASHVRAIIIHEGKILLMERWRGPDHYFSLPGGQVEPGETPETALVREIEEETTMAIEPVKPVYIRYFYGRGRHDFWPCRYLSGQPRLHPDSPEAKLTALGWNRFSPGWFDLASITDLPLWPAEVICRLQADYEQDWPEVVDLGSEV